MTLEQLGKARHRRAGEEVAVPRVTAAARVDNVVYVQFPAAVAPVSGSQRLVAGEGGTVVEAAPGKTAPTTRPVSLRFVHTELRSDLIAWCRFVGFLAVLVLIATAVDHIRGALQ